MTRRAKLLVVIFTGLVACSVIWVCSRPRRIAELPWREVFYNASNRYDVFPSSETSSLFLVGADLKILPENPIACEAGECIVYYSFYDGAVIVWSPGGLMVLRMPKHLIAPGDQAMMQGSDGKLTINSGNRAFELDIVRSRVRRLPSITHAAPGKSKGEILAIDTLGHLVRLEDSRTLKTLGVITSIPSTMRSAGPLNFQYDRESEAILCSDGYSTALYVREGWTTSGYGQMLLDPFNHCLWASGNSQFGLRVFHRCFTYSGEEVMLRPEGDYPDRAPGQTLDAGLVKRLMAENNLTVQSRRLKLVDSKDW